MTLQAKLDAFKADFRAGKPPYNAPPEIHPIMERATAELIASGATSRALVTATRFLPPNFWRTDLWSSASTAVCGVRTATSSCRPLKLRFRRYARRAPTSLRSRRRLRRTAGSRSARTSSAFPILGDSGNNVAAAFGLRFKTAGLSDRPLQAAQERPAGIQRRRQLDASYPRQICDRPGRHDPPRRRQPRLHPPPGTRRAAPGAPPLGRGGGLAGSPP